MEMEEQTLHAWTHTLIDGISFSLLTQWNQYYKQSINQTNHPLALPISSLVYRSFFPCGFGYLMTDAGDMYMRLSD